MDNNLIADTTQWVAGKDYPEYFDNVALSTISKGYLLPGETPRRAYRRVAKAVAERLNRPDLENKFFKYIWNGWIGLASPVLSNTGTDRGLPISCFGIDTPDSIRGIGLTNAELMRLTSYGGGVGISVSRIRPRGTEITGNGKSEGVVPWCKIYDSTIIATNQGSVRRGAASVNLDINHPDIEEFLQIRRPKGDPNRQCLNLHQCVVVDDAFMRKLNDRDENAMKLWLEILKARVETGEPYIMFKDNINKNNPLAYAMNNLDVSMTNICVTGDTQIQIKIGEKEQEIEIQDLEFILQTNPEVYILSYNQDTLKAEYKLITNFGMTNPEAELLEIEDEATGFKLQCTPEHKILTKNRGWVEAQHLTEEDELVY
jgi:ribonucleoside-diphosphate reductase alpha chain